MTFGLLCVSKDCSAARRAKPWPISGRSERQLKKQRSSPLGSLFSKGRSSIRRVESAVFRQSGRQ